MCVVFVWVNFFYCRRRGTVLRPSRREIGWHFWVKGGAIRSWAPETRSGPEPNGQLLVNTVRTSRAVPLICSLLCLISDSFGVQLFRPSPRLSKFNLSEEFYHLTLDEIRREQRLKWVISVVSSPQNGLHKIFFNHQTLHLFWCWKCMMASMFVLCL